MTFSVLILAILLQSVFALAIFRQASPVLGCWVHLDLQFIAMFFILRQPPRMGGCRNTRKRPSRIHCPRIILCSVDLQNCFFIRYYSDCKEKQAASQARSEEDAKKLWEISEKLVGLKSD